MSAKIASTVFLIHTEGPLLTSALTVGPPGS